MAQSDNGPQTADRRQQDYRVQAKSEAQDENSGQKAPGRKQQQAKEIEDRGLRIEDRAERTED